MTIKVKKISLNEAARNALLKASDGALTKEAVDSLATTVESLMNSKIKQIASGLTKQIKVRYESVAKKAVQIYTEKQNSKVSKYVNYVVTEWVKKNKPAIQNVIEAKRNAEIVKNITETMGKVYMKIPGTSAEKVVSKLSTQVESLTKKLASASSVTKANENAVLRLKKMVVLERLGRDLTAAQREKFVKIAMESNVSDIKKFVAASKLVRESVTAVQTSKSNTQTKKPNKLATESQNDLIAWASRV